MTQLILQNGESQETYQTTEAQQHAIRKVLAAIPGHIQIETIIYAVSRHTGVTRAQMESTCRRREIVYARHLYRYISTILTDKDYKTIARVLNNLEHTVVIHSKAAIRNWMANEPKVKNDVETLINTLNLNYE